MSPIVVPQILDAVQVAQYREQGFLLLPDLLPPSLMGDLRRESERLAAGELPIGNWDASLDGLSLTNRMRRIDTVYSPHHVSSIVRDVATHSAICGVVSQIAAAHRVGWDGSAKFVQGTLFYKPPGMQGHAWHQDDRSIQTWDQSLCAAWIPLDATTRENGCLWIVPGSHRHGYLFPLRPHGRPNVHNFVNEAYGFDEAEAIPLEMSPGSVLFFSGSLLHSSQPNRTDGLRRVLAHHYCNAWTELPWYDVQARQPQTDLRSVIPVAGVDPYAWKGYEPTPEHVYLRLRTREQSQALSPIPKP